MAERGTGGPRGASAGGPKDDAGPTFWGVKGACAGEEMRAKLEARRRLIDEADQGVAEAPATKVAATDVAAAPFAQGADWVDDFFDDLVGTSVPPASSGAPAAVDIEVDDLFADIAGPSPALASAVASSAAVAAPGPTARGDDLFDDIFAPPPRATEAAPPPAAPAATPLPPMPAVAAEADLLGDAAGDVAPAAPAPPAAPSDPGPGSAGPVQALAAASPTQVFGIAEDEAGSVAATPLSPTAAARAEEVRHAEDWYMLRDEDANEIVAKVSQHVPPEGAPGADTPGSSKSSGGRNSFWIQASALGKKAGQLGSKAKKAIVEEAKLVAEDVRELSEGVREGVQLTAQDTRKVTEKLKHEADKIKQEAKTAKGLGWLGGVLGSGGQKATPSGQPQEPPAPSGDAFAAPVAEPGHDAAIASAAAASPPSPSSSSSCPAPAAAVAAPGQAAQDLLDLSSEPQPSTGGGSAAGTVAFQNPWGALRQGIAATVVQDVWHAASSPPAQSGAAAGAASGDEGNLDDADSGTAALKVLRQSLANTAEVSKGFADELWRDVREANHDAMKDLRHLVSETSEAWQNFKAPVNPSVNGGGADGVEEGANMEAEASGSATPRSMGSAGEGAHASAMVKGIAQAHMEFLKKTAGEWRSGLNRFGVQQWPGQGVQDVQEAAFVAMPSSRANYVHLVLTTEAEPESPTAAAASAAVASPGPGAAEVAAAAQRRVRTLGGRLAKQTQKVVEKAKDLGHNLQARAAAGAGGAAGAGEDEADDGDSIFEIGSGDEDGLSDPGEEPGVPLTHSADAGGAEADPQR